MQPIPNKSTPLGQKMKGPASPKLNTEAYLMIKILAKNKQKKLQKSTGDMLHEGPARCPLIFPQGLKI